MNSFFRTLAMVTIIVVTGHYADKFKIACKGLGIS